MGTIADELTRIQTAKANLFTSINAKNDEEHQIPDDATIDEYYPYVDDIQTGTTPVLDTLNVSTNGTFTPPAGTDGYDEVIVNVPQSATLGTKSITANGTYSASSDNLDGYSQVTVNVPQVAPTHQSKSITITTNGTQTVSPDTGYDYLDSVEVTTNVQQSQETVDIYIDLYSSTVQGRQFRSDELTVQYWDNTGSHVITFTAPSTYKSWWEDDGHHKITVPKNSIIMVTNNTLSSNLKYRDANQSYWSTYNNTITNASNGKSETMTYHDGTTTYSVLFRSFYIANTNLRVVPFIFN